MHLEIMHNLDFFHKTEEISKYNLRLGFLMPISLDEISRVDNNTHSIVIKKKHHFSEKKRNK